MGVQFCRNGHHLAVWKQADHLQNQYLGHKLEQWLYLHIYDLLQNVWDAATPTSIFKVAVVRIGHFSTNNQF